MKAVFVVVGAVVGLFFVRGFMFDPIEEIAWRMFWHELFKGNIDINGVGKILASATFIKSVVGIAVGGVLGFIAATKYTVACGAAEKTKETADG
ncbi:MAG: hypothetical protein AAB552_01475 [Patescibacteria group bacterium]